MIIMPSDDLDAESFPSTLPPPAPTSVSPASPGIFERFKNQMSQTASALWHPVVGLVEGMDNKEAQEAIRNYRNAFSKVTGDEQLNGMVHEMAKTLAVSLPEMMKEHLFEALHVSLEYTWAKHPKLLEECVEATLFKMVDNLIRVARERAQQKGQPLPEAMNFDLLLQSLVDLVASEGESKLEVFNKRLEEIEANKEFDLQEILFERRVLFKEMNEEICKLAFPKGADDLVLPNSRGISVVRWALFRALKTKLPKILQDFTETMEGGKKERLGFLGVIREKTTDGVEKLEKLRPLLTKWTENLQELLEKEENSSTAEKPKGWTKDILKQCENSKELFHLLKKADSWIYPLIVHVIGHLLLPIKGERKPLITVLAETVLCELLRFFKSIDVQKLEGEIAAYRETYQKLEESFDQKIKALEEQFGDVTSPEKASEKVARDHQIAEVRRAKNTQLQAIKTPFDPLITPLLSKMGLDAHGLGSILPFYQDEAAFFLQRMANHFALDFYDKHVKKQAAASDGKVRGLIQKWIDEADMEKLFKKTPLEGIKELKELKEYAAPLLVDLSSNWMIKLATTSPIPLKTDIVSHAFTHLFLLAAQKLPDFEKKMRALVALPEGSTKDALKKQLLNPLAEDILIKGGLNVPSSIAEKLLKSLLKKLLPYLMFKGIEVWVMQQELAEKNRLSFKNATKDGDAVTDVIEKVSDHTGAFVQDMAQPQWQALVSLPQLGPLVKGLKSLAYPLVLHALNHLAASSTVQPNLSALVLQIGDQKPEMPLVHKTRAPSISTLIHPLLTSIFTLGNGESFEPLVQEVIQKAGLSEEGLTTLFPFGSSFISDQIQARLLNFCKDFHQEVSRKSKGLEEQELRFLQETMKALMPSLREELKEEETQRTLQGSFLEAIEESLGVSLPQQQDWVMLGIQDLVAENSPHWKQLEPFIADYLVNTLADFFVQLVPSKKEVFSRATAQIIDILSQEIQSPSYIEEKLKAWRALPERTEAQKKLKVKERVRLRAELFEKCAQALLKKGGWDNPENIRAPKMLKPMLRKWMEQTLLPDQLFRIALNLLLPLPISAVNRRILDKKGVGEDLNILAAGFSETLFPFVHNICQENASLLVTQFNREVLHHSLPVEDEVWLAHELTLLFQAKPLQQLAAKWLHQVLCNGMTQLVLNAKSEGEWGSALGKYFHNFFKNHAYDPTFFEKVRIYQEQTAPLKEIDKNLRALQQTALKEYPHLTPKTLAALEELSAERREIEEQLDEKFSIKELHEELLKEFQPHIAKMLADMGYTKASDLPVPYFLKETLWKKLSSTLLPELCLSQFEKYLSDFDSGVPSLKSIKELEKKHKLHHEKNLKVGQLPPPEAQAPVVVAVHKLVDYLIRQMESYIALHGREKGLKLLDEIVIPKLYAGPLGQTAVRKVILQHREEIAQWIEEEGPHMGSLVKERLGPSLKQLLTSQLLQSSYSVLQHLEKIEEKNPDLLFDLIFSVLPLLTEHLDLATRTAKSQGKDYIHEVDPLIMTREFEKKGLLHPAMPGWQELQALKDLETYISQLEEQARVVKWGKKDYRWYLRVDRLKKVDHLPEKEKATLQYQLQFGPEYFLEAALGERARIEEQIQEKMQQNFFEDFTGFLLKLGGMQGAKDLPGENAFWKVLGLDKEKGWNLLQELAPQLTMEVLQSAVTPQKLTSYMAKFFTLLNESLKRKYASKEMEPHVKGIPNEKVKEMQKRCKAFLKMMERVLPGTIIQVVQDLPFLDHIPGRILAESLRETLQQFPLSKIVEENFLHICDHLPEQLPKTFHDLEALKKQEQQIEKEDIEKIQTEAEKTVPNFILHLERNAKMRWLSLHRELEKWLESHFSERVLKAKRTLDAMCHHFFIDLVALSVYSFFRWLISFFVDAYGKRVAYFADLGRQSLVSTSINANLLFLLAERFQKLYQEK